MTPEAPQSPAGNEPPSPSVSALFRIYDPQTLTNVLAGGNANPSTDRQLPLKPEFRDATPSEMVQRYLRQSHWEEPCGRLIAYSIANPSKPIPHEPSGRNPAVGRVLGVQHPSREGLREKEILDDLNS